MATIYIDNAPFEVDDSNNLLHAILSLGINLPYFCWHPKMGSVGACRQCAVKQFRDEKDTRGRLVMACMTPAKDGTRISINDPDAHAFRASIIEWLMENHPHDCPVCDEGGECHLQDMTLMTGHDYRRYRGLKRTFRNQYLGPFVNHEMNRCIQCYRCVRYYQGIADGKDLAAFALRNHVYFGRATDGVLESEFSGNLVEVCPTGVFTDATLKQHYTRKWDLQNAPSICVNCSVGCNTVAGERYGVLRRIHARYNGHVNGYFLCDRGRYGYEFVNSEQRIRHPIFMSGQAKGTTEGSIEMIAMPKDQFAMDPAGFANPSYRAMQIRPSLSPGAMTRDEVVARTGDALKAATRIIGIGSPRTSLESNFALRELVGSDNFFQGVSELQVRLSSLMVDVLKSGPARSPSLSDVEQADAVLVLGEDATNTAPLLALALRQAARRAPIDRETKRLRIPEWDDKAVREAIQDERGPVVLATLTRTKLEDIATGVYHAVPDEIARFGFAIARSLGADTPEVQGLGKDVSDLAAKASEALKNAKHPLVVAGSSLGSAAIIEAAANVAWALHGSGTASQIAFVFPEANSFGTALLGGKSLDAAMKEPGGDVVIVLENDLYRRADPVRVDQFLQSFKHVIALDALVTPTTAKAQVVFPAATFAEADGTLVSNEGRAQRSYQVFVPQGEIVESWRWLREMGMASGRLRNEEWTNLDAISGALAESLPIFRPILEIAPPADFRIVGQKIAKESKRYSGRTSMTAHISVREPRPPQDPDSPMTFTMEGFHGIPPPALIPEFRWPGWNSTQAIHKYQIEVGGGLRGGDPGKRLIEPESGHAVQFFSDIPFFYVPPESGRMIVPLYHIFGSEELSVLTPGVAQLMPMPYMALGSADASNLGMAEGRNATISLDGRTIELPVRLVPEMPVGTIGLPSGLPGFPYFEPGSTVEVKAA